MAKKQLSDETIRSIRMGVNRVLRARGLEDVSVETHVRRGARGRRSLSIELGGREDFPAPPPRRNKGTSTRKRPSGTPESVLRGMHRVLKYRGIDEPVSVRLAGQRLCWVCRVDAGGTERCGWEPC